MGNYWLEVCMARNSERNCISIFGLDNPTILIAYLKTMGCTI